MLPKPLRLVWGDLSPSELKKFGLLATALMLTVGPYWMLRGIREAIFIDLVGVQWQPWGKIVSFLFIIPIVFIYSKLIDLFRREKLFCIIYPFYTLSFFLIAFCVAYPNNLFLRICYALFPFLTKVKGSVVGWSSYVTIESFGALAPALFWSFVASKTTVASAKRGYGMILTITQLGTLGGTLFVAEFSQILGLPIIIIVAACFVAIVPFIIQSFSAFHEPEVKPKTSLFRSTSKPKTGFFEGLRLLITNPYLLGIFIITTGYEVICTVLEFQMNILGNQAYPTKEAFAAFYARFGLFANGLALIFALVGTSFFLRVFGLRFCLLFFPVATGLVILSVRSFPLLGVVFTSMIILKGLSYSLNTPSKEILYIPTTRDVKFKTKSWIDVFGIRSIKASGSGINAFFRKLAPANTITYTAPILLSIVALWAIVARLVGVKYRKLVKNNEVIGATEKKEFVGATKTKPSAMDKAEIEKQKQLS